MASPAQDDFQNVKSKVLSMLKAYDPSNYKKLEDDPSALQKTEKAIKITYDELKVMMTKTDTLEGALAHLSSERQELIKTTFRSQSFQSFQADIKFSSSEDVADCFGPEDTYETNAARIVFEIVFFLLNFIGIAISPSEETKEKAIRCIIEILAKHRIILEDVGKIAKAAKEGSMLDAAAQIIACLFHLYECVGNPLFEICKLILGDLSWSDWIKTAAQISAFCVSGPASVAKLVAKLPGAIEFLKRVSSLLNFRKP